MLNPGELGAQRAITTAELIATLVAELLTQVSRALMNVVFSWLF